MVVRRLLGVLAGERIRARVQRRVVQNETQVALVHRAQPFARVSESAPLNAPLLLPLTTMASDAVWFGSPAGRDLVRRFRAQAARRRALGGRIHLGALGTPPVG